MDDRDGQDESRLSKNTGRGGREKQPSEKSADTMSRGSTRPNWTMTPEIQNKIGQQLRAVYSDIVDQGVPDRFAKLIDQLDGQPKAEPEAEPKATPKADGTDRPDAQAETKRNEPK